MGSTFLSGSTSTNSFFSKWQIYSEQRGSWLFLHWFFINFWRLPEGVQYFTHPKRRNPSTHKFFNQGVKGLEWREPPPPLNSQFCKPQSESCFIIEISANCWQRTKYMIYYSLRCWESTSEGCRCHFSTRVRVDARSWLQFKSVLAGVANRAQRVCLAVHSIQSIRALDKICFSQERLCNWESLQCLLAAKKCFLAEMFHILCWQCYFSWRLH